MASRAQLAGSLLAHNFKSFPRKRARIRAWAAGESRPEVVRLTSPAATRAWLASLGREEPLASHQVRQKDA